ncbi:tRNA lysidine(34) synthetase TilS [Glycomyces sp. L485]|uniref:tRNA lysidine(34) synthetase TilS n=1 Tax=Glycomyces sp. L485 TaxID=2909235 RepID=UPI001F4AB5E1|nr:tRNA lysidine(34) synthetase TilS [Glycomyces sp. L485]MCH7231363.1 tRNA lysidine(34) synthetase TilS [Glycomyces sp. L485]
MARLPEAVARMRTAVRDALTDLPRGSLVLSACSGGPDSLALADTLAFVAPRAGLRAGLVTVDHGLQEGSAERAADVAEWGRAVGLDPSETATARVLGSGGPEAAARQARYAALDWAAERHGARTILLGHTRDDQAETVLLALTRGAGPRGIAGMRAVRGRYRRPLLDIARADTHAVCEERGLKPWTDPHNADPRFKRSALRQSMEILTGTLGDDIVANLARTAALVAADNDLLDAEAAAVHGECLDGEGVLRTDRLAELPAPLRQRVLRTWIFQLGVNGADLNHHHLGALDALVTAWHGQGPAFLPGGVEVSRRDGKLRASGRPRA